MKRGVFPITGGFFCAMLLGMGVDQARAADEAQPIKFREVAAGAFSGIQEPMQRAITNQMQWQELWKKHSAQKLPAQPAPAIDFDKETALFLGLGRKNTGGYSISAEKIVKQGSEVVVHAKTKSPPPGSFTIQALTSPFQIVALPKTEGKIRVDLSPANAGEGPRRESPRANSQNAAADARVDGNPLLQESSLPYQFPPFDRITDAHYIPAFAAGMAEHLREIEEIAESASDPTFENTIVAMERSGETLSRVSRVFFNLNGTDTNPRMQEIEKEMAPKLSAHGDAIRLNSKLFARLEALHEKRDALDLDAESKRLLERYYIDFVRAGAKLSEEDKTKLKALNSELATLQTTFSQNVLKEVNASAVLVESREDLAGLSENAIAAAAAAAKGAGEEGKFLITLKNTSDQPPLSSLRNRELRERIHRASLGRNSKGGEFDNREVVSRLARLRAERAALLGYPNHAAYQLEEQTAKSIGAVNKLLGELAPPAVANARREAADLQAVIREEGKDFRVQPWDWAFYSEKVRKARYAFDEEELRPYFEMNRVLVDGVFYAATKLYGITFKERKGLPLYHPDTQVFEVFNEDGSPLALFIVDFYARPSKRGGAWANAYVSQSHLRGLKPVIANHLNVPKPPEGEPTLLTWDEVTTAFHEFGHALHAMFSDVKYPRFAGTSVPRDFVEYPSQVNEMWAEWPEILAHYARHHETGEPLPKELIEKVKAASKFNQGFATTEYLAAALLDQAWHQMAAEEVPGAGQVLNFEQAALKRAGVDFEPVPPRYRTTYFSHIFSSGYSAGYYSYIWSEVLDADTVEWFKENGGLKRANGDRFRRMLLSRGHSLDAIEMFRSFRGRDPEIKPLLERRGLTANPSKPTGQPSATPSNEE